MTAERRPFLILLVGFTPADVRWLETDPEAQLEADLERDERRRRWLSAPPAVVERYRQEVEPPDDPRRRGARTRVAERRARYRGDGRLRVKAAERRQK